MHKAPPRPPPSMSCEHSCSHTYSKKLHMQNIYVIFIVNTLLDCTVGTTDRFLSSMSPFMCVESNCVCVPFSGTTQVSQYQKGKTNLDFTEARDSEWQWHQLDDIQVCTLLQTDNHTSTPPLCFLQAGCPSCRLTNSVKALKACS